VQRSDVHEAGAGRQRVHAQEVPEVLSQDPRVRVQVGRSPPAAREQEHRRADDEHRERRQHERRSEDRADADVLAARVAGHDRHERQDRLGQRGADRGQHAADHALGQAEALPDPLDPVGEQLGAAEDHEQRRAEQRPLHRASIVSHRRPPVTSRRGVRLRREGE
jgi:hypothetical protein